MAAASMQGPTLRILYPLRSTPTALLWGGLSLSALGDQLYAVALSWIAVGVLGTGAGYLTALRFLVVLLAVLGIGRWADSWQQRRSMIGADLGRATVLLAVVAAWLGLGAPSAAWLVVAVIVLALGQAVFQPALQVVLPGVVADAAMLPAANGLLDATERSARLLGPGLVGLLAGVVPTVHFLTIDAASFLASAAALLWIGRLRPGIEPVQASTRETVWRGVLRGIRAMQSHPLLGYVLQSGGPINGAWHAVFLFALPLGIARQGVQGPDGSGLGAYALVISAYGCTNLIATLLFGSCLLPRRPQFQMFLGSAIVGCGMVLMGLAFLLPEAGLLPGLAAGAAFAAVGGPMKDIPVAVLRQTRLRLADMAAAMRAYMAAVNAGALAGMLLAPGLIDAAGVIPVIIVCGGLISGVALLGLLRFANWTEPT